LLSSNEKLYYKIHISKTSKQNRGELLKLWRNIANSRNNIEFIHNGEKIKFTDVWLKNPKAQVYFIKTWLAVEENGLLSFLN